MSISIQTIGKGKNAKDMHVVTGIFGEGGSDVYENAEPNELTRKLKKQIEEASGEEMFRYFATEAEARAYRQGIEDMEGWQGFCYTSPENHQKIFGKIGKIKSIVDNDDCRDDD